MVGLTPALYLGAGMLASNCLLSWLGRVGHYAFDAVLISAFLAGIKRSTGLTKDVKKWIDNYLGVGEWVMDQSVAVLGSSSFFERKR